MKRIIYLISLAFVLYSCGVQKDSANRKTEEPQSLKVSKKDQLRNKALYIDASRERLLGNYETAMKMYEVCLTLQPNDAASMYELSKLYSASGRMDEAISLSEQSVEIDPQNPWYMLLLSRLYQLNANYDANLEILEKLVDLEPYNIDYLNELAQAYMMHGRYEESLSIYNTLQDRIGLNEYIVLQKQKIYLKQNNVTAAIEELEDLIAMNPQEPRYYAMLAEICIANNMQDKALDAYNRILEIDPNDPYIQISISDFHRKNGNEEEAYQALKEGFLNPRLNVDTKVQVLLTYYSVDELYNSKSQKGLDLAEILVKTHPEEPKAFTIYGDLLRQAKQLDKARETFRTALHIDSSNYMVWEQLLFVESELSDFNAMTEESLRAIELFPNQPLIYLFAGVGLYQQKKYEKSTKYLERGVKIVFGNDALKAEFYSHLGDNYNQIKDYAKSDESYDKALLINPLNSIVLNNYAYFLSLRNERLEKAEEMAKKAVELDPGNASNLDTYAWVLYKAGKYEEAETWILEAIEASDEVSAVLMEHHGDILYKLGQKDEAWKKWKIANEKGEGSTFLEKKVKEGILYE